MKRKNDPFEKNLISTSTVVFIENYNKSIPQGFPRVTGKTLKQFQIAYPGLFKKANMLSIDKHRKRLMDWLSSQQRFS